MHEQSCSPLLAWQYTAGRPGLPWAIIMSVAPRLAAIAVADCKQWDDARRISGNRQAANSKLLQDTAASEGVDAYEAALRAAKYRYWT